MVIAHPCYPARPDQATISTISDHTAITQLRLEHGAFKYRRPLRLGPRGACAALPNCPQACNGFVSENPDGSPKYSVPMSSQPKIDHSPEADLSMDVVFPSSRSETPLASFAPPSAALSATSTMTSSPLVQHRPVVAFSNISRPSTISVQNHRQSAASSSSVAAGVQQSRRASIQRSFHPTQPGSSTAPTALTSPKNALLVLPLYTSDYNDTVDLSPRYFWKTSGDLEKVQNALDRANLVFTVDVDITGPIFDAVDTAFQNHCQMKNLDFATSPDPPAAIKTPNTLSWGLLGPRGRPTGRTWVEDPKSLTRFTFTLQAIRSTPFSHTPNNLGDGPFIFVEFCIRFFPPSAATLLRNADRCAGCVKALLTLRPLVSLHPMHMWDSDDDEFPEVEVLIERPLPPARTLRLEMEPIRATPIPIPRDLAASPDDLAPPHAIVTRSVRRQQWQQEATATAVKVSTTTPFIAGPLLTSAMELGVTSCKPRSFVGEGGALDLTLQSMPGAGAYSLSVWQDHILSPRDMHDDDDRIVITARSVDEGARVLIMVALWIFSGRPTGLNFKELLQEQFASPRPTVDGTIRDPIALFGLHVSIGPGVGKGPRNEVVARALKIALADGHYCQTEREAYMTLRLHPSRTPIPHRSYALKATGLLLLLHFLFIDSLSLVKRIERVPLNRPVYTSQAEDSIEYQYLLNIPEVDPSMIAPHRSRQEHDGVCLSIISFLTLGTVDIEHHPDFLALSDGFNACVEAFGGQERPHHILEWFATPCWELIIASYDRKISGPADILSHLDFTQTNPADDVWGENTEIVVLITQFITHYLSEPGNPADPNRVFHALMDEDSDPADTLLRPKLFLSVLTGSTLLPIKPTWKIKCLITHDWSQEYPTIDADGQEDYGPDVTISFRSCFKTFSITNNACLRWLLMKEDPKPGSDTEFGSYIHGQLLASREEYTSS
ncbi:hypothetical protein B0H14DRAFT_2570205 [Mycena olivaceomarginata]|nr:hypothetical protein B0H14DRAFT_2570205 [Mycena olivaceomarginata]